MARGKQKKFDKNKHRAFIVEDGKPFYQQSKGRWHQEHFGNENPIVLELACGRGEYTVGLAQVYPERNFIGIDIKGDRIWKGGNTVEEKGLTNASFLRTHIQNIEQFFGEGEVDEIWIVHPDPRPKERDAKRRLTHPRFLDMYRRLLRKGGTLRLKTDSRELFYYTVETLVKEKCIIDALTFNLYESELLAEHHGIRTRYEGIFTEQGHDIYYVRFRFE